MSTKGKYVRRHDRNGNAYFIDRETGRRVSQEKWQRERDRIARRVEREQEAKRHPPKPHVPPPPQRPAVVPPIAPPPIAPPPPAFPRGVEEPGFPVDEFGEWEDDTFAIEGEDDTG